MKVYTKTGDKGETSLVTGERVKKYDNRVEAYGTIDELNASIGVAMADIPASLKTIHDALFTVQHHLFDIGSELSNISSRKRKGLVIPVMDMNRVSWLESCIDECDKELTPLTYFILPGGSPAASQLQLARAICRRAERQIVALIEKHQVNPALIAYVNRLSDLLFTLARYVNFRLGIDDVQWDKKR